MADSQAEPTNTNVPTGFVPPTPEIVDPKVATKSAVKKAADKKRKAQNKPTGEAVKVEKKKEAQYIMDRNVKYDGVLYEKGTPVELDGEMKTLFLKNGFCKMQ